MSTGFPHDEFENDMGCCVCMLYTHWAYLGNLWRYDNDILMMHRGVGDILQPHHSTFPHSAGAEHPPFQMG